MEKELAEYVKDVLEVCSLRAAFVINHIIAHGSINSEQLRDEGYVHGARAVGDVRDNGVPLITGKVKNSNNVTIGKYTFGSAEDIKKNKFGGRVNFPPSLKGVLIDRDGLVCSISNQRLPATELQIDHRIPYYIAGDISGSRNPDDFMLLSKSMQRSKSWDCEHCENLKTHFDIEICRTCYWAYPENYTHLAMRTQKSLNIVWQGDYEVMIFNKLEKESKENDISTQEMIKFIIKRRYDI